MSFQTVRNHANQRRSFRASVTLVAVAMLGTACPGGGDKAGVFLSNGYVTSFHILPMPAPCTATNVSYVLASGVTGKFLGFEIEIARKAITEKRWNFQIPQDRRCNADKG